ncbi:MAG: phosphate acyltransferase PlsX [Burkholderiales bacterium]|nr:phosphate acyltransferase PlsX [Burkholderiales bacterium]
MPKVIAIDAMGGDHGPEVTVPAARDFLMRHADAEVILVGRTPEIEPLVTRITAGDGALASRLHVRHAAETVTMDDPPTQALRRKRESSMHLAVGLVKDGKANAAISAGNTGAWMAISAFLLRTLPGIDRPAICAPLPNQRGGATYMLDLGANVDCKPQHLYQFALMGSALVASVEHKDAPVVGLLNIGEEEIKGNETVKEAADLLRDAHAKGEIVFFGNVEGNDIFKGTVDVVVCDGFVGNVALKTSEGLAQMLGRSLKAEFERNWLTRIGALFSLPAINGFRRRYDHRRYNGACLLGLNGLVVKSHGSADAFAFGRALDRAYEAVSHNVVDGIGARIARHAGDAGGARAAA